jgi:parallel beta-helix repeat protein
MTRISIVVSGAALVLIAGWIQTMSGGRQSRSVATRPRLIDVRAAYGTTDAALRKAVAAARRSHRPLYFSAGTYTYDSTLPLRGITAYGDGPKSILRATNPSSSAIVLRGRGVNLRDLQVSSPGARTRIGSASAAAVRVDHVLGFSVRNVVIDGAASSGIVVLGGANGLIAGNTVQNTRADAIHLTDGSHDITVSGNVVRSSGDDMIAVVSYVGETACKRITITRNRVIGQVTGRGISTVGGEDVTIERNSIGRTYGAGVYVAAEASYDTLGTLNVRVIGNTIERTDVGEIDHAAIHVVGRTGYAVRATVVADNVVRDAGYRGIFVGDGTESTLVAGNELTRVGQQGIYVDGARDVTVRGNSVRDVRTFGLYATSAASGRLVLTRNTLRDVNMARITWVDVIMVESETALESGEVSYNVYSDPGGYPFDKLVESSAPQVAVFGNRATP